MTGTSEDRWSAGAKSWWFRACSPQLGDPGVRARLRRCRDRVEGFLVPEALDLATRLVDTRDANDATLGTAVDLARVLAHVKSDDSGHPMRKVGRQSIGDKDAKLSEGRFRRILLTTDGEERVSAFVRLIALMDGNVNITAITNAFRWWDHPSGATKKDWAFKYYGASSARPESLNQPIDEEGAEV